MPLHNVGYRPWTKTKTPQWSRWWIIASTGIRLGLKNKWVKRIVFFAWLPVLYWSIGFFVLEKGIALDVAAAENSIMQQQYADAIENQLNFIPNSQQLADAIRSGDHEVLRNTIWNWLLMSFFRYPQAILILFMLGFIAPGLISQDVRSRAFLIYFSKPIGRLEYIVGKLAIPTFYIVAVTCLPAILLYVLAVGLSPDLTVVYATWEIPFRIILATIVLVIPTASLALMLSALTHESRFASFAWFAVWALGHGAWFAIVLSQTVRLNNAPFSNEVMESPLVSNWSVLSLYNNLGEVQNWIFGFSSFQDALPGCIALTIVTLFSLVVLFRQVSAPIRI